MSLNIIFRYLQLKSNTELYLISIAGEVIDTVNVNMVLVWFVFLHIYIVDESAKIQFQDGKNNYVLSFLSKFLDTLNFIHGNLSS